MKRNGLSMAAMVATVVMVLTVSTYAITARTVNPVVGLSFQGTTAVCHAKCFAGSDNDNIQATLFKNIIDQRLRICVWCNRIDLNILPYTIEVLNGRISRYFHCKSTDGACSRNHQGDTGTNDFFHVRCVLRFIMIIPATTIAAEMR